MILAATDIRVALPGEHGARVPLLDGAGLRLSAGEIVDLTGPSGSGKSTLLRVLARLLPGASVRLALDGRPAEAFSPQVWRTLVALQPQVPSLAPGTIADNLRSPWRLKVRAGLAPPSDDELRAALDRVHLADVALDREVSRLSVGQRARVALLRTVLTSPRVLLLDEPDASLDDASALEVAHLAEQFAADGGAVLRVRHRLGERRVDRVLRLEAGRLSEVGA